MNKVIPSLLAGLILGGGATWLALKHPVTETPPPPPDTAPKIEAAKLPAQFTTKLPVSTLLTAEVKAYGRVLDPAPLIATASDLRVALVAATASEKEFARTKALHDNGENATLQAVETAEAAMLRDDALRDAARAKLATAWGRPLVERADFPELVHALTQGEVALVRLDLLPGDAPEKMPATAQVGPLLSDASPHDAEMLGAAPAVDAQTQGVSYLALWRGAPLPPGTALRATLATGAEPVKVMVVPGSALVRNEGGVQLYVKTPDGGYERRLVEVVRNLPDGVALAGTVVDENDKVVVTGAQQLLANEILSALGGEP